MKEIILTQGKKALVDDEDFKELNKHKWHARRGTTGYNQFYAARNKKVDGVYRTLSMHQQILKTPKGMHSDHINHDTLDNRKLNLRICTASQNQINRALSKANKSRVKGVFWSKTHNCWCAQIGFEKRLVHLGFFNNFFDAVCERKSAENQVHREYTYKKVNLEGKKKVTY